MSHRSFLTSRYFINLTRRRFTSTPSSPMSQSQSQSRPATDPAALSAMVEPLLVRSGGRWTLARDGGALERSFKFKTFAKAWDFMTGVSIQCKINNHHPEWSNTYNTTFIRWTTHNPKGLTEKDVDMAYACDAIAEQLGELEPEPEPATASCEAGGDLADKAASRAGDCCGPKK